MVQTWTLRSFEWAVFIRLLSRTLTPFQWRGIWIQSTELIRYLNNFKKNNCASSVYHGMTISIDMIDDNPIKFNLMALRSFSESFYHAITDSALEYGYQNL